MYKKIDKLNILKNSVIYLIKTICFTMENPCYEHIRAIINHVAKASKSNIDKETVDNMIRPIYAVVGMEIIKHLTKPKEQNIPIPTGIQSVDQLPKNTSNKFYKDPKFEEIAMINEENESTQHYTKAFEQSIDTISGILATHFGKETVKFLEVGSSNCVMTNNIVKTMKTNLHVELTATDLFKSKHKINKIIKGISYHNSDLASEDAVNLYGKMASVLMLISPPPCCHMDYYAISTFEKIIEDDENKKRFIIYFGDMGNFDGGAGMHPYMFSKKSKWVPVLEQQIGETKSLGPYSSTKKIYLFMYKN